MPATSRSVSWLSLNLVVLLAIGIGLVGNYQIVSALEREYGERAVQYSRDLGRNLIRSLEETASLPLSADEVEARFRRLSHGYAELSGTRLYLYRADGHLVASGDQTPPPPTAEALVTALADEAAAEHWLLRASHHRTSFVYAVRPHHEEPAAGWALVIERDVAEQFAAMHRLHYRVSALLLFAVGLVAVASFMILRRVGARYERRLERALAERTAQLERAHQEMLHKARLATLGQTASMLAHEIRNPLASIKFGLSGLLERPALEARDQERLRITLREVDYLNELLGDALKYARPVRRSSQPLALGALIEQVIQLLTPSLQEKGLRLVSALAPDSPPLRLDAGQFEQALINLLKNAIEASPTDGMLEIRLESDQERLTCLIRNEGPPIPAAQRERLFEPFNSSKPSGTGLGLSLVKRVVDEHGGRIDWSSSEEEGTEFRITLPLEDAPRSRKGTGDQAEKGGAASKGDRSEPPRDPNAGWVHARP